MDVKALKWAYIAWMSLNELKWASMSCNESKWAQISLNEPKTNIGWNEPKRT